MNKKHRQLLIINLPDLYKKPEPIRQPKNFHVTAYCYNVDGVLGNPRTISSINTRTFDYDPSTLVHSGCVESTFIKMNGDPEKIGMLMVKMGKYGKDTFIFDRVDDSFVQRIK